MAHVRGVLGLTPGDCWPFYFPIFFTSYRLHLFGIVANINKSQKAAQSLYITLHNYSGRPFIMFNLEYLSSTLDCQST